MTHINPAFEAAPAAPAPAKSNFIRDIVIDDLKTNKFGGRVQTRFPPEPNGYLHLGQGQSDSIEKVTHSLCTLEFEDHRPLYNWFIEQLGIFPSQQIEFDRLSLTYTLLSKRKLLQLVNERHVRGWDDPRMPTLSGVRRRGYTAEAPRNFSAAIGVSKTNGIIELAMLEHFLREDLNKRAARVMAVLRPLKVVIENYPQGQVEQMDAINNPEDASAGTRKVPFSRVLYIERDDFRENPPKQFYRLSPGREVRLRYGYLITCTNVLKEANGEVVEVHCTYDPATRGGNTPDGRKVKSTIHWVSAAHALPAEVRLCDHLFMKEDPNEVDEGKDWTSNLNPNSLEIVGEAKLEPSLANAEVGARYQFERLGYFCVDPDSKPGAPVFNRTVATLLVANGEDVKTVQESLRHANSKVTLDLYAQALMPAKRKAQSKIVQMLIPAESNGSGPAKTDNQNPLTNPFQTLGFEAGHLKLLKEMVARDGIEPPPPAFSDPKQQALTTTYKSRETAEVLGNTYKTQQLLTRVADNRNSAFSRFSIEVIECFEARSDLFGKMTK